MRVAVPRLSTRKIEDALVMSAMLLVDLIVVPFHLVVEELVLRPTTIAAVVLMLLAPVAVVARYRLVAVAHTLRGLPVLIPQDLAPLTHQEVDQAQVVDRTLVLFLEVARPPRRTTMMFVDQLEIATTHLSLLLLVAHHLHLLVLALLVLSLIRCRLLIITITTIIIIITLIISHLFITTTTTIITITPATTRECVAAVVA